MQVVPDPVVVQLRPVSIEGHGDEIPLGIDVVGADEQFEPPRAWAEGIGPVRRPGLADLDEDRTRAVLVRLAADGHQIDDPVRARKHIHRAWLAGQLIRRLQQTAVQLGPGAHPLPAALIPGVDLKHPHPNPLGRGPALVVPRHSRTNAAVLPVPMRLVTTRSLDSSGPGEFAQEFARGGVDDADVQVADEHEDGGPGVGAADADVVEPAVVAEGEFAVGVDAVGADAVVAVGGPVAGGGFGPGGVGGGWGGAVRQGAVRPLGVVDGGEGVQEGLELGEGGGLGRLGGEPGLEGLPEPLDLALGLWAGLPFFCLTPRRPSSASKPLRPPRPPANLVVNTSPLPVKVEAGIPCSATADRNSVTTAGPLTRRCAVMRSR